MAKMKIEVLPKHYPAYNEIRKSTGVTNLCRQIAETRFAGISGIEGYVLEPRTYKDRNGFAIRAAEYPAIADNIKNNTLEELV